MGDIFWENVATVIFPEGWRPYDRGTDSSLVVCLSTYKFKHEHWWDHCANYEAVFAAPFVQSADGEWTSKKGKPVTIESKVAQARLAIVPARDGRRDLCECDVWPVFVNRKPQETAMEYCRRANAQLVVCHVNWGDTVTYGFFAVPDWEYFDRTILTRTAPRLRNFFENVPEGAPVRFYADFDAKLADIPGLTLERAVRVLKKCVANTLRDAYGLDCPGDALLVFSSSTAIKISIHLVGSAALPAWEDAAALRSVVDRVRRLVFLELLGEEPPKKNREKLVDMTVYDKNSKFRLWQCCKIEDVPRPKTLVEGRVAKYADALVCCQESGTLLRGLAPPARKNFSVTHTREVVEMWARLATLGGEFPLRDREVVFRVGKAGDIFVRYQTFESLDAARRHCRKRGIDESNIGASSQGHPQIPFSFGDADELVRHVARARPTSVELGALYCGKNRAKEKAAASLAKRAPLVMDIDMDDEYDRQRACACKGDLKKVCDACWRQLLRPAMKEVLSVLAHLGFRAVLTVFSGRRGFHVWVLDRSAWDLADEQRQAIYAQFSGAVHLDPGLAKNCCHLIKVPLLRHPGTGNWATPIADPDTFVPSAAADCNVEKCIALIDKKIKDGKDC